MDDDTTTEPAEPGIDTEPELPELPVTPVTEQHPALGGDEQAEVTQRTADPAGASPMRYSRTFVIGQGGVTPDHEMHRANAAEVLSDAIRRGLHPKGDVHVTDIREEPGRRSVNTTVTYEVDVVPAVVDRNPGSTLSARDVWGS